MEQSKLDVVRNTYDELCDLRDKILKAQDTKIFKEDSEAVKKYYDILNHIDYYSHDEYFEDYQRRIEKLSNVSSVKRYLKEKESGLLISDELLNDDDVIEYTDLFELLIIDRKKEIIRLRKELEDLKNDPDLIAYKEALEILKIQDEEEHIDSAYIQYLAFKDSNSKDNTYIKIKDGDLVRIVNMDTGEHTFHNLGGTNKEKRDAARKRYDRFKKTHNVINNENFSVLGVHDLEIYYRDFYLKDRSKDAKTATKEARQYLRNYGKN